MFSFLSKLQRKPEHVRNKIALVTSAFITGIIIVIWLVSLGSSYDMSTTVVPEEKETGPFQALTEGFNTFFADTTGAIQTAASAFSEFSKKDEQSSTTSPKEAAPTTSVSE